MITRTWLHPNHKYENRLIRINFRGYGFGKSVNGPFGGGWTWKLGVQGSNPFDKTNKYFSLCVSLLVAEISITIQIRRK